MNITFIIPTYRKPEITEVCLRNIRKHHKDDKIIVVEDDVKDLKNPIINICKKFKAKLMFNGGNHGFSRTVNKGLKVCDGDIAVLINNDVILTENIKQEIIRVFTMDDKIGVLGFLLHYPDGDIQHGGVELTQGSDVCHVEHHCPQEKAIRCYQSRYEFGVTGALFCIRMAMAKEIGLFSEEYKLAFEDIEYCIRTWAKGWRVYYTAGVNAFHVEGFTRGATQEEKDRRGFLKQEEAGMPIYRKDASRYNLQEIVRKVKEANL